MDSIKSELGKGRVVSRSRQTGKTLALMEYVHENNPGMAIVVTCNGMEKERMRKKYRAMFPGDDQPIFVSVQMVNYTDVCGTNRRWATDEVWPETVVRRAPGYELAPYLGGVGTPMCMDMHSN